MRCGTISTPLNTRFENIIYRLTHLSYSSRFNETLGFKYPILYIQLCTSNVSLIRIISGNVFFLLRFWTPYSLRHIYAMMKHNSYIQLKNRTWKVVIHLNIFKTWWISLSTEWTYFIFTHDGVLLFVPILFQLFYVS